MPVTAADTRKISPPSFVNDVTPIFTRLGCNQGACHGKGAGQNGFRLSLRGYAPEMDYVSITREFSGRRINVAVPDASILLGKPLGIVPHEGGKLFSQGSREYQIFHDWIAAGGPDRLTRSRKSSVLKSCQVIAPSVSAMNSNYWSVPKPPTAPSAM